MLSVTPTAASNGELGMINECWEWKSRWQDGFMDWIQVAIDLLISAWRTLENDGLSQCDVWFASYRVKVWSPMPWSQTSPLFVTSLDGTSFVLKEYTKVFLREKRDWI